MRLTAIIPIFGFDKNREEALKHLIESIKLQDLQEYDSNSIPTGRKNFEAIFIEQADNLVARERPYLKDLPEYMKHIVLPYQDKGFNKSWVMNVAVRQAVSNSILFIDADTLFDTNYFERVANFKEKNFYKFFLAWEYIILMPGKDNPITRIIEKTILTAGGSFCIEKDFFWSCGGMCENYFGYGAEDNDFWLRANLKLGNKNSNNVPNLPYALLHWYHDWAKPSEERQYYLNRTRDYTIEIISRLASVELGNPEKPTLINFSDLQ